jgi:hypothetical protein
MNRLPSSIPDKEDRALLKGKSPSYIMGWNKVKHRHRTEEEGTRVRRKGSRTTGKGGGSTEKGDGITEKGDGSTAHGPGPTLL